MSKPRIFETFCMREDLDNRKDLQSSKKCAVSSTDSQVRQKGTSVSAMLVSVQWTKFQPKHGQMPDFFIALKAKK